MSVADMFNIPGDERQEAHWSIMHMVLHRSENQAILTQFHVILPEYILDPVNWDDPRLWLQQHQLMHNYIDQGLGIDGENLTDVDWSDLGSRAGWIQAHAQLHQLETNALGLTA
jgi:hypothetical protein